MPPPTVLQAVLRYPALALAVVLLTVAAGLLLVAAMPPLPTATALLVVSDPSAEGRDGSVAARYTKDQAALVDSLLVAEPASRLLARSLPPAERLDPGDVMAATGVTVSESNTLDVGFTASTPELAREGARAVVQAYQDVITQLTTQRTAEVVAGLDEEIARLDAMIAAAPAEDAVAAAVDERARLASRRTDLALSSTSPSGTLAVAAPALPPVPLRSALIRNTGVALTVGLALAGALCYLRASRRMEMDGPWEPRAVLGAPLLGEVELPRRGRRSGELAPAALTRSLESAAACVLVGRPSARVVAVLSPDGQSGGSRHVASGLALVAHREGRRVVLLTVRPPEQGRLSIERVRSAEGGSMSLVEVPDPRARRSEADPARVSRPSWIGMQALVADLEEDSDLVVLDLTGVTDSPAATALVPLVGAAVPVVEHGTPLALVEDVGAWLALVDAEVVGYVYARPPRRRLLGHLRRGRAEEDVAASSHVTARLGAGDRTAAAR